MKRVVVWFVAASLLVVLSSAQAALRVDFGSPTSLVEDGFEQFGGVNANAVDLYAPRTYSAFETTVTVSVSWNPPLAPPNWSSMRVVDRSAGASIDQMANLLRDWIGTDGRQYGDPLTLTISGLPAGEYPWLSYHHDADNQTGEFDVVITDASGVRTFTGIQITDRVLDGVVTLAGASKFSTMITSDGSSPVVLTFTNPVGLSQTGVAPPAGREFFIMNGFEIIPEPATIALLGLGALALRRRRS